LYASNNNYTETEPQSKDCSTIFQGHVEKRFTKDNQRKLSDFCKKSTAEFKEQLNKVKDKLGAIQAGMYMLVWNAILAQLMGQRIDQGFDDVDLKGLPFHHMN
jgi:hypothetical protein